MGGWLGPCRWPAAPCNAQSLFMPFAMALLPSCTLLPHERSADAHICPHFSSPPLCRCRRYRLRGGRGGGAGQQCGQGATGGVHPVGAGGDLPQRHARCERDHQGGGGAGAVHGGWAGWWQFWRVLGCGAHERLGSMCLNGVAGECAGGRAQAWAAVCHPLGFPIRLAPAALPPFLPSAHPLTRGPPCPPPAGLPAHGAGGRARHGRQVCGVRDDAGHPQAHAR